MIALRIRERDESRILETIKQVQCAGLGKVTRVEYLDALPGALVWYRPLRWYERLWRKVFA